MTDVAVIPTRPEGRPSKYDPAYCDAIIDHMSEGWSATSFAASVRVARSTLNQWAEDHAEFSEALKIAKAGCAAWWEARGRTMAESGGAPGQSTMVTFGLKNMGKDDWSDSVKHVGGDPAVGDKPIQTLDLTTATPEQLAALAGLKLGGE